MIFVALALLASWVMSISLSLHFNYVHKVAEPFESFDVLYDKPWQRVGPYIMGKKRFLSRDYSINLNFKFSSRYGSRLHTAPCQNSAKNSIYRQPSDVVCVSIHPFHYSVWRVEW